MRKLWVGMTVGIAMGLCFIGLLVIGVYTAASNLLGGGGGGSVGLAKGAVPDQYQALVQKWGNLCPALNPAILAAQIYSESAWNPKAVSPADARGIAQFIPGTWDAHAIDANGDGRKDIWDPQDAIPSAAVYDCELSKYVKGVPGDLSDNMLASYNAGSYAVIQHGGIPPYRETQGYVRSIRTLEKSFARPVGRVAPSRQAAGAIYYAQEKLGTPYLWGGDGTTEDNGRFDCSGLTKAAYESVGITLPRVANDQWNAGPHPKRDELIPGDLVFFATDLKDPRSIHHVGIYVGGGQMINAPYTGAVIRFDKIDMPDYIGATRVTQDGAKALPAGSTA
ncbi:C40 family peptidase [Streptomyces roseoverticillatus]|uniref:C40 family peptidase n=1 Tax=Streptomyces roseoverticillatus TaxID=66429 RepID=UPI0027E4F229|nr:bifunctional lytic transglycosylase/C40 family peptidase [Streptomyces roseoverticillatus]